MKYSQKFTKLDISKEIELWSNFKNKFDYKAREALILHYMPLARSIGIKFSKRNIFYKDDAISLSYLALVQIVDLYKLDKNTSFKTYLNMKLPNLMIDELRKHYDPQSRSKVKKECIYHENMSDFDTIFNTGFVEDDYTTDILINSIYDTLPKLKKERRIAVECYLQGMSGSETLKILQKEKTTSSNSDSVRRHFRTLGIRDLKYLLNKRNAA